VLNRTRGGLPQRLFLIKAEDKACRAASIADI
jgi:hypothetical protein